VVARCPRTQWFCESVFAGRPLSPSGRAWPCPAGRFCGITLLDVSVIKCQLHLSLFIHSRRHHEASWRHKGSSPLALTYIRYYQDLARRAENALFDSNFLADQLGRARTQPRAARTRLEAVTVPAAAAVATSRTGMIATASTTYSEPFNLARQFASLHDISNGRVA
jgi:hypothetical protein